ncbi:epoxide hydrolase family protein [Kineococcus glutinatus]|uniref:Epoxide hydrolase n=1 Tax=Kineococcus glutinatus TaxID=1070872 RepID=A0ABP9HYY5_9ACTN
MARPEAVVPAPVAVPGADLADLRERLRRTRWPEPATVDGWSQGVPLEFLQELCLYWAERYDWRAAERRLNAAGPVRTRVDGLGLHALHVVSPEPGALPLLLLHGWPGSVLELLDVLGPLSDPRAHGGDPADAFTLVVPSLPGYGFSDRPAEPGWGIERTAAACAELVARLGHGRFGTAGCDWGTSISTVLARDHPDRVLMAHLVPPLVAPDPATLHEATPRERAAIAATAAGEADSGYALVHRTRPQTIGYALVDSPAALCAWLVEKFWAWSEDPAALDRDRVLDVVTSYWLTGTGASAARLYRESHAAVSSWFTGEASFTVDVPVACTVFPADNPRPSRRWAGRRFRDVRHWGEPARGGHFPALEQPAVLVAELRAGFRHVR